MNQISWNQIDADHINVDQTTLDRVRAAGMSGVTSGPLGAILGIVFVGAVMVGLEALGGVVGPVAGKAVDAYDRRFGLGSRIKKSKRKRV